MPNISEVLNKSTMILQSGEIAEPRREAASLLAFALQKDKTFLIAHSDYNLTETEDAYFQELLARRAQHEPFQYLTGKQEFFGLEFAVTPDVLIPRPETEMIVESAIEILRGKEGSTFCEIGTGSGCIAVAILYEVKTVSGVALDISEKALEVAKKNAEKHAVSERLKLKISDVLAQVSGEKFDLIVSNPPYIPAAEITGLQPEVRDFEPLNALTDGKDGLSIIERIVREAPRFLTLNGSLLMEIGIRQADEVMRMFDKNIWGAVEVLPDLQGIPRMVRAGRR